MARLLSERVAQYERHVAALKKEPKGIRQLREVRSLSEVMKLMILDIGTKIGGTNNDKTAMELVILCRRCSSVCSDLIGLASDISTKLDAMERTTK